jgi:hypothetical protein
MLPLIHGRIARERLDDRLRAAASARLVRSADQRRREG